MAQEQLWKLVGLGEDCPLKLDLNKGVAGLFRAPETSMRPHICLNGFQGAGVLKKIFNDPRRANTEFGIRHHLIMSADEVWLNASLYVFFESITWPTNFVCLSPRQSGYIVKNLPLASREIIVAKVKKWYFEEFLVSMKKGLEAITEQFMHGDPFLASDYKNRIFDIHGERSLDVPYTECAVVGSNLFGPVVEGKTCWEQGSDGYQRADDLISAIRNRQQMAINDFLGLARGLEGKDFLKHSS